MSKILIHTSGGTFGEKKREEFETVGGSMVLGASIRIVLSLTAPGDGNLNSMAAVIAV